MAKVHRMPSIASLFPAKEPLIIELFCGKSPIQISHPLSVGHPPEWMVFVEHVEPVMSNVTWLDSVVKRVKRVVSYVTRMGFIVEQVKRVISRVTWMEGVLGWVKRVASRATSIRRITCDNHSSPVTICYRTFKSFYKNKIGRFSIVLILRTSTTLQYKKFQCYCHKKNWYKLIDCFLSLARVLYWLRTCSRHSLVARDYLMMHYQPLVQICAAVCCSVLQCVTVCCSVLQCVEGIHSLPVTIQWCNTIHLYRFVLQCAAVCCSVLHCVAVNHSLPVTIHWCNTIHS